MTVVLCKIQMIFVFNSGFENSYELCGDFSKISSRNKPFSYSSFLSLKCIWECE